MYSITRAQPAIHADKADDVKGVCRSQPRHLNFLGVSVFIAAGILCSATYSSAQPAKTVPGKSSPGFAMIFATPVPYAQAIPLLKAHAAAAPEVSQIPIAKPSLSSGSARPVVRSDGAVPSDVFATQSTTKSVCGQPAKYPPEVVELARGLKCSVDLIYEYVYNNIETIPQYGSLKGPVGTILDGAGTAIDQAELMFDLLDQSGISGAEMDFGEVSLTSAQLANWLGGNDSGNSTTVANGGIPITLGATGGTFNLGWAWVRVPINGTVYAFTPSIKTYAWTTPSVTVAQRSGYSGGDLMGAAHDGYYISPDYTQIQGVNRAAVRSKLQGYATNVLSNLQASQPSAGPLDLIGGKTIVPLPVGTQVRQANEPSNYVTVDQSGWTTVPAAYNTTITLALYPNNTSTQTPLWKTSYRSADLYGHRLSVFFNASNQPVIAMDGSAIATGSAASAAQPNVPIGVSIYHPYACSGPAPNFCTAVNQSQNLNVSLGGSYIISNGWGPVGRNTIEKHKALVLLARQGGAADGSESVLGESLEVIGFTWLAEVARATRVIDQLAQTTTTAHHNVGIVGQSAPSAINASSGPYVDLPLNVETATMRSRANGAASIQPIERAVFFADTIMDSVFESGVLEQEEPGSTAVSTTKLVDLASQSGIIINAGDITHGGTPQFYEQSTKSELHNYSAADLARITNFVDPGTGTPQRVLAPSNGSQQVGSWTGAGFYAIGTTTAPTDPTMITSLSISAIISGGLSGGYPASSTPPGTVAENAPIVQPPPAESIAAPSGNSAQQSKGADPVDLVTGAYIYNHDDLTVGAGSIPYGLGFSRAYDSGRHLAKGTMGLGWTHNYDIRAVPGSDGFEGLGENSARNAAAAVVGLNALYDIMTFSTGYNGGRQDVPLDYLVAAAQVATWTMDQLKLNVVDVVMPSSSERFGSLPNYTFGPPPGSGSTMTYSNGYVYTTKDGATLTFNGSALSTWKSPAGPAVSFSYDGSGRLTTIVNPYSRALYLSYGSAACPNQVTSVADQSSGGRSTIYGYDGSCNLTSVKDANEQTTIFSYGGGPGLLSEIFYPSFPNTAFLQNIYDDQNRVFTQIDAANATTYLYFGGPRTEVDDPAVDASATYFTPQGKPRLSIDAAGAQTSYSYDGLYRPTQTTLPGGGVVTRAYDSGSNLLSLTQTPVAGSVDSQGRLLAARTRSFTYGVCGTLPSKPCTATDFSGNVTTYGYDSAGDVTSVARPAVPKPGVPGLVSPKTSATYDGNGLIQTSTDAEGTVTSYSYDSTTKSLLSVTADAGSGRLNLKTQYGYDSVGNMTSVQDPRNPATAFGFDAMRRLGSAYPYGDAPVIYGRDADGRVTSVRRSWDSLLQTTSTSYLATGQVSTVTDPSGDVTTYSYYPAYHADAVKDGAGRTLNTNYDQVGRVSSLYYSGESCCVETHSYTADGALYQRTDGDNHVTTYGRDGYDRLSILEYADGTSEAFTYSADDDVLTRVTRAGQSLGWSYDALHRPASHSGSPSVTYGYDYVGRLLSAATAVVAGDPSTGAYGFSYDAAGRRVSESDPDGRYYGASWDATGNLSLQDIHNAGTPSSADQWFTSYYDTVNRLTQVYNCRQAPACSGSSLLWQDVYDGLGRPASRSQGGVAGASYGYTGAQTDLADIGYAWAASAGAAPTLTYGYNGAHQVTSYGGLTLPHPATAGSVGQGTPTAVNELPGASGQLRYDANGNLTSDGVRTYTYDGEGAGRILTATFPGGTATYRYDALGRRYSKTVSGVTTVYLHDVLSREVAEFDGASGSVLAYNLYDQTGTAPVARVASDGVTASYALTDRLGSVTALLNASGQPESVATGYVGFGAAHGAGAPPPGSGFGLSGYRYDAETGLYHAGARYYDPRLGRFVQPDPIRQDGGINLYAYVNNDPLNNIDPSGLAPGDRFPTPGGAALDALQFINPTSIQQNVEYAGKIRADLITGQFYAEPPVPGGVRTTPPLVFDDKADVNTVGDYHTHGDYSRYDSSGNIVRTSPYLDQFDSDRFSNYPPSADSPLGGDVQQLTGVAAFLKNPAYMGYLGTPGGKYLQYSPATGETQSLK